MGRAQILLGGAGVVELLFGLALSQVLTQPIIGLALAVIGVATLLVLAHPRGRGGNRYPARALLAGAVGIAVLAGVTMALGEFGIAFVLLAVSVGSFGGGYYLERYARRSDGLRAMSRYLRG